MKLRQDSTPERVCRASRWRVDCVVLSELLPVTAGDRMAGWAGFTGWLVGRESSRRNEPGWKGERPPGTPPSPRAFHAVVRPQLSLSRASAESVKPAQSASGLLRTSRERGQTLYQELEDSSSARKRAPEPLRGSAPNDNAYSLPSGERRRNPSLLPDRNPECRFGARPCRRHVRVRVHRLRPACEPLEHSAALQHPQHSPRPEREYSCSSNRSASRSMRFADMSCAVARRTGSRS